MFIWIRYIRPLENQLPKSTKWVNCFKRRLNNNNNKILKHEVCTLKSRSWTRTWTRNVTTRTRERSIRIYILGLRFGFGLGGFDYNLGPHVSHCVLCCTVCRSLHMQQYYNLITACCKPAVNSSCNKPVRHEWMSKKAYKVQSRLIANKWTCSLRQRWNKLITAIYE